MPGFFARGNFNSLLPFSSQNPEPVDRPASRRRSALALLAAVAALASGACTTLTVPQKPPPPVEQPAPPATVPPTPPQPPTPSAQPTLAPVSWQALSGWSDDDPSEAWSAFLAGCTALRSRSGWAQVCTIAQALAQPDRETARRFFETYFTPYRVSDPDGGEEGLVTGYYEPLLNGSRKPSSRFRYALYGVPDDLLTIDLGDVYPQLKGMRLRGRLEGRHVVPYYSREQIDNGGATLAGRELVWVDDPVELFFLQIQGSGRVRLDDGQMMHVGYADQNGYPYRSIGKLLVERGDLPLERASMQGIKNWAKQNPDKLNDLLNYNASYVFFRELPNDASGPPGALGVPLTAGRSLAVDARSVPLGAPVFLATTWPNTTRPLNRLMLAQDTGGAIRGAVRGDFYWGFGEDAAREAGRMKQAARMWVLLPNDSPPPAPQ